MRGRFAFYVEGSWFRGDGFVGYRWAWGTMDETVLLIGCHCCWVQLSAGVGKVVVHPWRAGGHKVLAVGSVHSMQEMRGELALVMDRLERRVVVVQRDGANVGVQAPEAQVVSHSELVDAAFPARGGTCCSVDCAPLHAGVRRCRA